MVLAINFVFYSGKHESFIKHGVQKCFSLSLKKKKQKTAFSAEKNLFLALNKSQIFGYLFCLISFKKNR